MPSGALFKPHFFFFNLVFATNWVVFAMDNAANLQEGDGANPAVVTGGVPPVAVPAIRAQHPPIPPTPFFHGFGGTGN